MKNNVTRLFVSVISAVVLGFSLLMVAPLPVAACGGCGGGSGGIFSVIIIGGGTTDITPPIVTNDAGQ